MVKAMLMRIMLVVSCMGCCLCFSVRPTLHYKHKICAQSYNIDTSYACYRQCLHRHMSSSDNNNDDDKDTTTRSVFEDPMENKRDDKRDERQGLTYDEMMRDPELREREFKASMKRKNELFLGQTISRAVQTLAWGFVAVGFIANILGYAWVADPSGGLKIGTLEERDFQREMIKEKRRAEAEKEEPVTISLSRIQSLDNHVLSWLEQDQYS